MQAQTQKTPQPKKNKNKKKKLDPVTQEIYDLLHGKTPEEIVLSSVGEKKEEVEVEVEVVVVASKYKEMQLTVQAGEFTPPPPPPNIPPTKRKEEGDISLFLMMVKDALAVL